MAKPFHLQPLVDLSEERTEAAARALGKLKQTWVEAENKRSQLQQYLEEYRSRLHQQTRSSGLTALQWRDFQTFISKLELAIEAQGREIERCQRAWEVGQVKWQDCERELKAYQTLRSRHDESERKRENKQDQRLQDEFARNLHQRKNTPQE